MANETFEERRRKLDETEREMLEGIEQSKRDIAAKMEEARAQILEELATARAQLDREQAEGAAYPSSSDQEEFGLAEDGTLTEEGRRALQQALAGLEAAERKMVGDFERGSADFARAADEARMNFKAQREDLERRLAPGTRDDRPAAD